ncbi:MAG TPA: phage tail sheath C-terminal domain-containing protein [Saprospiraceae bacterium]|nr:phage tail sheath C-terminal domain-containing protein [Saprospiraceae bacterium]
MLNLSILKTPGVYIDEVSLLPPSVAGVETGIPAFIGYTEKIATRSGKDLKLVPTKIYDMKQFEELYGMPQPEDDALSVTIIDYVATDGTTVLRSEVKPALSPATSASKHTLHYSMQMYFANGGGPCYIITVGTYTGVILKADLDLGLKALESEDEPTMIVTPEAVHLSSADYFSYNQAALNQAGLLKDRFVIIDVQQKNTKAEDVEQGDIKTFRDGAITNNRHFGAAYYPYLDTTIDFSYVGQEDKVSIVHSKIAPDGTASDGAHNGKKLDALKATSNLLYMQLKDQLSQIPMQLPPSAAMAGIYATTDTERGVWKAPANVGVASVIGPSIRINDAIQGNLNVDTTAGKSVNVIRQLTGRGTVVWGARTLEGNDNEWRYIPVRRFFNFVEESVKKATYRFVFEPNDANTWVKVRAMVENFLTLQWRAGALQGAKPEQAFFVRVGLGQTMTALDVLEGRLIVEIGMAVVRPAEFIILRFMHKLPEA